MKYLATLFLILGFGISAFGQTIKSLGYNTTNGQVVYSGTNMLTFTNAIAINGTVQANLIESYLGGGGISIIDGIIIDTNGIGGEAFSWGSGVVAMGVPISFATTNIAATTRANLGFSTNLNTLWTSTNTSNARSAVVLGWPALTNSNAATSLLGFTTNGQVVANTGTNMLTFTNHVAFIASDLTTYASGISSFGVSLNFEERKIQDTALTNDVFNWSSGEYVELGLPIAFVSTNNAATTRTNLGLGGGITTNCTFVSYNGTNYTTNTVTISNGIITGWTQ